MHHYTGHSTELTPPAAMAEERSSATPDTGTLQAAEIKDADLSVRS